MAKIPKHEKNGSYETLFVPSKKRTDTVIPMARVIAIDHESPAKFASIIEAKKELSPEDIVPIVPRSTHKMLRIGRDFLSLFEGVTCLVPQRTLAHLKEKEII